MPLIPLTNVPQDFFKNQLPLNPARAGWLVDPNAFDRATKELNITYPIRVRYSGGRYTYGTHYARAIKTGRLLNETTWEYEQFHVIVLLQNRPLEEANETLWHELRHAMQAEQYAELANRTNASISPRKLITHFYRDEYLDGVSYKNKYYEVDARDFAVQNKHINLLKLS